MSDRRRFPVGLTLAMLAAMAILLTLGTWQLQRMAWKRDLLERVAALEAAPPRPLADVLRDLAAGKDVDLVRVEAVCPGLGAAPFLELYGLQGGQAGARLISACPQTDGPFGVILVDRGFVGDDVAARPPVDAADPAPVRVVGVLRRPDAAGTFTPPNQTERWFSRDAEAMARALGASRPAPVFLMAETPATPGFPQLRPAPLPAEISNRHLEYAVTWYGLAAALAGVYLAVLLRRRKT